MEVAAAEREAREVLHTLLAVERLEPAQTSIKKVAQEELDKSGASFDKLSSNLPPQMYQKILLQGLDHRNHVAEIIDEVIDDPAISDTKLADNMEQEHEPTRETATKESKVPSKKKQATKCKLKKNKVEGEPNYDPTKLEDSAVQVLERFKRGCECQDDQCFIGLSPEAVYRHRLNIAELTKAEHDMYLMGVTMACLTNPYHTAKHTERRRLRAQYVYQGRRVCLDAFLYLENCTHYQIKRIRKHLIMHGVTPRVHGNHGKVPHNTFSLDIYKIATEFLKDFVKKQEAKQKTNPKNSPLHLSPDITRKTVHDLYSEYCRKLSLDIKIMGYSTFRRFMKVQFPQVKFAKLEFVVRAQNTHSQCGTKTEPEKRDIEKPTESTRLVGDNGDLVPVVLTGGAQHNGTYFLTPVNKLQEGVSYQLTTGGLVVNRTSLHGTMENTSTI